MAFNDREVSSQDGKPIALYEFTRGDQVWHYTSADRDITWGVNVGGIPIVWTAISVTDEGITQGGMSEQDAFNVNLQSDIPLADMFVGTAPSGEIWLTVRRLHEADDEAPVMWVGTVSDVSRPDAATATITCRTMGPSFRRGGLRLCWERGCPLVVFGKDGCRLDKMDFMQTGAVAALTGNTVDLGTGFPHAGTAEYYDGGFVEWLVQAPATYERRSIESTAVVGGHLILTMLGATDGMTVGLALRVFPGCDHLATTCDTKFDNMDNYGGFRHMPGKSPFDGDPVF